MNIYQNGAFSEILHKLTKYQALAASAKDFSKQNLYSQKIKEYRNKLDKMNFAQTGGALNDQQRADVKLRMDRIGGIGTLLANWQTAYSNLQSAHNRIAGQLNELYETIKSKINVNSELEDSLDKKKKELTEMGEKYGASREDADKAKKLQEEIDRLKRELQNEVASGSANQDLISRLKKEIGEKRAEHADSIKRLQSRLDSIEGQLTEKEKDIVKNAREIAILQATNEANMREMERLRAELATANEKGNLSANCQQDIQEVLTMIDGAINGVNEPPAPTSADTNQLTLALKQFELLNRN